MTVLRCTYCSRLFCIYEGFGFAGFDACHVVVVSAVVTVQGYGSDLVLGYRPEWAGVHAFPATCAFFLVDDYVAVFILGDGVVFAGVSAFWLGTVLAYY